MNNIVDYDVIVIGAGGAGLAGAVWAAEAGCSVLVLEADDKVGGSTSLSEGVFNAADTSLQRKLGLTDSIDDYIDYYMTLNAWRQPAGLIRKFCYEATPTLEWLISLGVRYPERIAKKPAGAVYPTAVDGGGLYAAGVEYPPRGHCPVEGGSIYIELMDNRLGVLGGQIVFNTRVQDLLVEDGQVCGVVVEGAPIRSHAVLLASGGITRNPELVEKYFPDAHNALPSGYSPRLPSAPCHRGDGLRMALAAGAEIVGINTGLINSGPFLPNAPKTHYGFPPTSLIYVNRLGRRFVDETAPYAVMPGLVKNEGGDCWGVFDESARLRSDPTKSGWLRGWDPQLVLDLVAQGDIKRGDTLAELAEQCGMRPGALETAVTEYNEDLSSGIDRKFLRKLDGLHVMSQPPFYAFPYRNVGLVLSNSGPRIDEDAHVLDADGQIIPGLFAAGECGAGVIGERYVGGGNSVANAITMGRVAGMTMGREISRTTQAG